ncbi:MAG: hypothetical protein JWO36_3323 [Myxococcales bacterium]|nr:hypothetical protein [Myxococcales bacterium]
MSYLDHARSKMTRLGLVIAVVSLHAFVACGGPNTHIEQAWTAPNARFVQFHRVATLFAAPDGALRRGVEDKMAQELMKRGVQAIPAYTILSDLDVRNFQQSRDKLLAAGVDGVITMRSIDKRQKLEVVPPTFDGYWGWGGAWPGVYDPGYAYTETIVRMQTNVYSVADNQLVWSAVSKTVDPGNTRKLIDNVTKVVASELQRHRLVAPPNVAAG